MNDKEKSKRLYRVVAFLNREELDCLDEVSKDIYFKNGMNLPRTKLIKAIIDTFKDEQKEDMEEKIKKIIKINNGENDD